MSVVEQRLDAVRAVLDGGVVEEVAADVGVHRTTLHRWVVRYLVEGVGGLSDRSHRPRSCPHQVCSKVEAVVAEMRREHPRWGAKRIRMEMLRKRAPWASEDGKTVVVPSLRTVVRILQRQGLARSKPRKRPRGSYVRFERPGPMQLWQMDIVGGVMLVNTATGVLREAKVVTAVDDHSRYCVIAKVVERATARAVCLALVEALVRFGVPEEILTDNGKQFTDRFGRHGPRNGEVLFDKICRKNAITHRLTQPASPNQNGKVERFHGTLRPDFLDTADPFGSVEEAQAAVDAYVLEYNTDRPHQALDPEVPVMPVDRFQPVSQAKRDLLELWLPPHLAPAAEPGGDPDASAPTVDRADGMQVPEVLPVPQSWSGGPIEFDRVVPPSGNLAVAGRQFWLGPQRAGQVLRFWADVNLIHLLVAGARIKTVRSHLTVNDLAKLVTDGAVNAGASPLPRIEGGDAIEVERIVARGGTVSLANHAVLAAEILGGRRVGIRLEPSTLMFYDLDTRELLRVRPNPLTMDQAHRLRGSRPAGPPPRPSTEPIRVQRRASNSGVIMVCGQKIALGRAHQHQTVTVLVSETTLAIDLPDTDTKIVRRTTTQPVRSIKGQRPRTAASVS
ncbi:IS481 family transposase [Kribbella pittospori]|uniref:IS481 family transposase n=1 Tax=Kribbella pittospori TaxID=722689 RepID=UPI003B50C609